MLLLRDIHGNPLGSNVAVSPTGSLDVYATSDFDGGRVPAQWVLTSAGQTGPSNIGTLAGYQRPPNTQPLSQPITLGPVNMVTYLPPTAGIGDVVDTVHAVLTASVGASTASLQLEVQMLSGALQ